ncbi:MAG: hypothetical protein N2258_07015 [Brevinematales bacterium]|nr:hypothetical protein [Brevinematales bacterium]
MYRIFYITIFIFSIAYSGVKVNYGIKTGLEQNFYDYRGESFKTKIQLGGGFANLFKIAFNDYIGVQLTFPGFYYIGESDKVGGYLYPDKIKLPIGFDFVFNYNIKSFYFEAGIGSGIPYFLIFSYYYPRYVLTELSGSLGMGYNFSDKFFATLNVGLIKYFDISSDVNISLLYSLSLSYRVF